MEKTISVEEKIRRAEEIYERRRQGNNKQVATVNIREKKDIKLLKKMIVQLLISICIYFLIYTIQNSNYVFSKDFINQINKIVTYDTNFMQIYNEMKEKVKSLIQIEEKSNENGIGGAEPENNVNEENMQENLAENETPNTEQNTIDSNQEAADNIQELSQSEQDVINIKNTTSFINPVIGKITSQYGQRDTATGSVPKNHTGTDIAANMGTTIKAATDGEVVLSSTKGDYGNHLKIQIGEVSIIYAHCSKLLVNQGDKITQGQEIAQVGSTGNSTGPHLHFEVRFQERTVDPEKILELGKE